MKSIIRTRTLSILSFLFIIFVWQYQNAQCNNCTVEGPLNSLSYTTPAYSPDWTTVQTNSAEGQDYMLFNVTKGQIYRWSTHGIEDDISGIDEHCASDSDCATGLECKGVEGSKTCGLAFDTELTLLKGSCGSTGTVLAYNRNAAYKNQSQIEWKSDFNGTVFLLVNYYSCQNSCNTSGTYCMKTTVKWQRVDSSPCSDCSYQYPTTYPVQSPASAFSSPVMSPSWTTTANNNLKAGEFQLFNVEKGHVYRWSTCSDTTYDTQLTLFRGAATEGSCGEFLAYNDDSEDSPCASGGKQSILKWTADFTGTVTILNNEYNCSLCYQSPNPTNPWGHCSLTTLDWQKYDCNICSSLKGSYTPTTTVQTVTNVAHGNYLKFTMRKGVQYRFRSTLPNGTSTFTGLLTLRPSSGTACSGTTLAQSEEVAGSYEQELTYTATSDFTGELLVSGPDCADPSAKKTTISYVILYDPDARYEDNYFDNSSSTPSCCEWTGVTLDTQTGLTIIDNNVYKDTWQEAIEYCENYEYTIPGLSGIGSRGNKIDDWILPNINQLYSIVDFELYNKATSYRLPSYVSDTSGEGAACTLLNQETACSYPQYICGDKQKCVRNNWYWSSTSVVDSSYFSWGVNMMDGRSYRVLKEDHSGTPATKHKVLCIRGASVYGELDMYRPAQERIFSGWACDKDHTDKSIDIYFLISDADGNNILSIWDYQLNVIEKIPGRNAYGFKYGETDIFPTSGSAKETKINANCGGTAQTVKHAFELDLKGSSSLATTIKNKLSGKTAPYYVTAYAGNYATGWVPKGSFVLTPENEVFVLSDVCGDGIQSVGEGCDDGNAVTETCAYLTTCMVCDSSCQLVAGYSPQCHDTILDTPDETCDCGPGYWVLEGTACKTKLLTKRCPGYNFVKSGTCTMCTETCNSEIIDVPYCGDAVKDVGYEACDDGDGSNNNACKNDCTLNYCGDGYIFNSGAGANETCDDGTKNGYYETECSPGPCCNITCNGAGPSCGDSILQRANCSGYSGCTTVSGANETCDKGAANGGWKTLAEHNADPGCNATCSGPAQYCGDGIQQTLYEVCDDGAANQDGVYGKCRTDCSAKPHCGDGHVDTTGGGNEICDDGTKNGSYGFCNSTCTGTVNCGDAIIQEAYEKCDSGTGNFHSYAQDKDNSCCYTGIGDCTANCIFGRYCGDAVLDDGRNLCLNTAAYYQFSESSGSTTADSSGGGKTGTLTNVERAYGKYGKGIFFDRASAPSLDTVKASAVAATTNLTLEAWVYPIGYALTGGYSTIILGNGAYYLSLYSNGSLRAYWYGKSPEGYHSTAASLVPLKVWTHVAAVWDASTVKLYINGVLKTTVSCTGTGNSATALTIGAESTDRQFYGIIDEVAIYTRSLDATELMSHVVGKDGAEYCDKGDADHGGGNLPVGTVVSTYETSCSEECKWFHYCGDGNVDSTEVCDDGSSGNKGDYGKCNPGCKTLGPRCGDGIKNGPEQCDKAPSNSDAPGVEWDGTNDSAATCRTNCTWAKCGDGVIDDGEECDDGVNNSDTNPNACRTTCKISKCGDKVLDSWEDGEGGEDGEECDDGGNNMAGILVYYPLDETIGNTAYDYSSNMHNGTLSGGPIWMIGKFGNSLYLDGTDDYVSAGNIGAPTAYTAMAWVKMDTLSVTGENNTYGYTLMATSSGYALWLSIGKGGKSEVTARTFTSDGTGHTTSGANINTTDWFHIAVTAIKGSTAKIYVNGVEKLSFTADSTAWAGNLTIGDLRPGRGIRFKGQVDDVRVYDYALSADEIAALQQLNNDSCINCKNAKCGDGYQKTMHSTDGVFSFVPNEACDDGNNNDNDYCRSDCQAITGYCGDGSIQSGSPASEACDNATTGSGIGKYCTGPCIGTGASMTCKVGCTVNHGYCGDGDIDYIADEACDDGNTINGDYCSYPGCKVTGYCGDGTKQTNEACDSADASVGAGQGVGTYCINDCQTLLGYCGDGKIQGYGYTAAYYGGTLPGTGNTSGPEYCDTNDARTTSLTVTTGCSSTCGRSGYCGDGTRQTRFEGCDGTVTAEPEKMLLSLNESSGSTAADSSTYGNNGTVYYWKENLVTYSQNFSNGVWSSYCGNRTNFSTASAPDLTSTALRIVMPSGSLTCSGSYGGWGVLQTVSPALTSGETYTVSIWLKGASGGETVAVGLNDGHMTDVTLTNEWKRYTLTFTGITNVTRGLQFKGKVAGQTYYAWGAQLQHRAKASAYTATTSSAASGAMSAYDGYGMWVPGKMGNGIQFDGARDYIGIPNSTSLNPTSITISMWLYLMENPSCDSNNNWRSLLHKGSTSGTATGYDIILEQGRGIAWDTGTGSSDRWWPSGVSIPLNTWTHLVLVYDETGSKKAYLNGVLASTKTITAAPLASNSSALYISNSSTECPNGSGAFPGIIDDVRIYGTALSPDAIATSLYDITQVCQSGCKSNPIGTLDSATRDEISGWGCDPDWPMNQANIRLEFYDRYGTSVANRTFSTGLTSEQSIQNLCGGGANHRWSYDPIQISWVGYYQPFAVKAYAVTPDGSPETDTLLGTKSFTMGPVCMDGIVEGDEECDDGNSVNTDSCRNDCKVPTCGDGLVSTGVGEICETGGTTACSSAGVPGSGVSGTATCSSDCKSWVTANKCYKTWSCPAKPYTYLTTESAWNSVSSYSQTWNGSSWVPADSTTVYNTTASSTSCRYYCGTNFVYNSTATKCVGTTRTFNCVDKPKGRQINSDGTYTEYEAGTMWNTVSSYTQTWTWDSGAGNYVWNPADDIITDYSDSVSSTTSCVYKCASGYHWNGSYCVKDDRTFYCPAKPMNSVWNMNGASGTYGQTWNSTTLTYIPADDATTEYNVIPSSTECRFICASGYEYDSFTNTCSSVNCGNGSLGVLAQELTPSDPSFKGMLLGSAQIVSNEIVLTPAAASKNGEYQYQYNDSGTIKYYNLGSRFVLSFDFYAGGGSGADALYFYAYTSSTPTTEETAAGGYIFAFDEYEDMLKVRWDNTVLTSVAQSGIDNARWNRAIIFVDGQSDGSTKIKMFVNKTLKINYHDTVARTKTGILFGFGARTGGDTNIHKIKNIVFSTKVCDDGTNNGAYNSCTSDCLSFGPSCGDGIKNGSETCDLGLSAVDPSSYTAAATCDTDCTYNRYCGDGTQDGEEKCDKSKTYTHDALCDIRDGSKSYYESESTSSCNSDCQGVSGNCYYCGDGQETTASELGTGCDYNKAYTKDQLCDKKYGARNYYESDSTSTCNTSCAITGDCYYCGDGVKTSSEVCDSAISYTPATLCSGETKTYYGTNGYATESFESNTYPATSTSTSLSSWARTTSYARSGSYSICSTNTANSSTGYIQFTLNLLSTSTVSFYKYGGSESGYDFLRFYVDGAEQGKWSGTNTSWVQHAYSVAAGAHVFKFEYSKDGSKSASIDKYCIDDFTFYTVLPGSTIATDPSTMSCSSSCTKTGTCYSGWCGDGTVNGLELCDKYNGRTNSDSWAYEKHCNSNCTGYAQYCGDGAVNGSETCLTGSSESKCVDDGWQGCDEYNYRCCVNCQWSAWSSSSCTPTRSSSYD